MSQQLTETRSALAVRDGGAVRVAETAREDVRRAVLAFLDAAATATGQATFYNTRAEQQAAQEAVHQAVFAVNRGLYGAVLLLPGVTDNNIQLGLLRLLDHPAPADDSSFLTPEQEKRVIHHLAARLPPQRLFKLYGTLRQRRVNNKRTRGLILRSILGGGKLALWAVKYRLKLRAALRHALGTGVANGVRDLAVRGDDRHPCARFINRYLPHDADRDAVCQCLAFILGGRREFTLPLLRAFGEARTDLDKGRLLPVEVLAGIRSRFHKDVPPGRVLELTRANLTEGQKLALQRSARRQQVELTFDPSRLDLVKLYVHALECGMTAEVRAALDARARRVAAALPLRYRRVGIVLDTSASMAGTDQAKNRPLAIGLAMRDVLAASATEAATVRATRGDFDALGLVRPAGDTALAEALVEAVAEEPDAVYLITDGYENAPSGRVDEVVRALRGLGVHTPVYQVTPVLAGETAGVRALSAAVAPLPVANPEALGLALVRAAIHQDVEQGIAGLLRLTLPLLEE
jgi:hypothetical protein